MTPRAVSSAAALPLVRTLLVTYLVLGIPTTFAAVVDYDIVYEHPAGFVHPPMILLQPSDRTIFAGQNATFSVSIHGALPLFYQWRFNDVDVPGANASILTLSNASTNQGGGYSVVVTNSAGSVTSTVAILVVNSIPDNTPPKGVYRGLFFESDEVRVSRAGFMTLTLNVQGAFSGSVFAGAQRWRLTGRLGVDGQATNDVVRRGTNALRLELRLAGADQITGKIRDSAHWESDILLDRAVFHARTNRAPWAATYTLIIPGWPGDPTLPCGDGFGSVLVDAGGNVRLVGTLADGTKLTQRTVLSAQGHWPLFAPVYRGQGAVLSWIQFDTNATDLAGALSWIKPASAAATRYPGGFTNETAVHGSRWTLPDSAQRVLQLTNGTVIFEEGGLSGPLTNHFILGLGGRVTNSSTDGLRLKITTRSGLFSGSVVDPVASRSIRFRGALHQKGNTGSGHFLGTNQSGHLQLRAAP